jgi:molybdopterin synthase catalytic subunit
LGGGHGLRRYPALGSSLGRALASVNQQYAGEEEIVPEGAEVAFFPPVSGGSGGGIKPALQGEKGGRDTPTITRITRQAVDSDALLGEITLPATGGACLFTGIVRGISRRGEAHETLSLEYEAYQPMAEARLRQIAEEMRARWPELQGIALVQRIGLLEAGTPTVWVACSAVHRDTGIFEAAHYGIDRLKQIVPVWKKEIAPDGETWIEGDYRPEPGE